MSSKTSKEMYLLIVLTLLIGIAGNAKADFVFGTPTNLGAAVNSDADDESPSISADGLILIFFSTRPGGYGELDLWMTTSATTSEPWGEAFNLGQPINTPDIDWCPSLSPDGCTLHFCSWRPGGMGMSDLWVSTRATREDDWDEPVNLGSKVNTTGNDGTPFISEDGLELYFSSLFRDGGYGGDDIWISTRESIEDEWGVPTNLGPVINTGDEEIFPVLSTDGLSLFFSSGLIGSARPGGLGGSDIWMARRKSRDAEWTEPVNLGAPVNSSISEWAPCITPDGSKMYFTAGEFGAGDIYEVSIDPIVDLNADGIVDSADMCIIVDNWGTDNSLCDIGPMPWGDCVVDVQDLIILSGHLFENVNDPTLIAHWALDETEGLTAHESVNDNDDFVMGGALWQPDDGKVNGAIEFDGVDDCIIGSVGPNPGEGPCSVIAWIKGGAPGQVIMSQPAIADLLAVDSEGNLITGLNGLGQSSAPLLSKESVSDGQWHRIALVWDGSRRALFVDGVKVAEDIEDGQGVFGIGLYIGVGKDYMAGTFFSGLIDDVRIYNRAVHP